MDLSKFSLFFILRFGVCVSVVCHSLMIQTGLSFDCKNPFYSLEFMMNMALCDKDPSKLYLFYIYIHIH